MFNYHAYMNVPLPMDMLFRDFMQLSDKFESERLKAEAEHKNQKF